MPISIISPYDYDHNWGGGLRKNHNLAGNQKKLLVGSSSGKKKIITLFVTLFNCNRSIAFTLLLLVVVNVDDGVLGPT